MVPLPQSKFNRKSTIGKKESIKIIAIKTLADLLIKKMIITADDLGFSVSRNAAILDAAMFGTVSAASLMVNMPEAENACRLVRERFPKLGVGLHFTLTSGRSIVPPQKIPLLTDSKGLFRHGFVSLWRNAAQPEFFEQIRLEFDAQLRMMDEFEKRYELQVDHLDSHQHIHAVRPIWNLLNGVATSRRLALRLPREPYGSWNRVALFRTLLPVGDMKKIILDFCTRNTEPIANLATPHFYFGVLDSGKMDQNAWNRILNVIQRFPDIPYEVNVHPGYAAEEEPICCSSADRKFHDSHWRQRELDVLLDPAFIERLKSIGMFPLRNWRQVCGGEISAKE